MDDDSTRTGPSPRTILGLLVLIAAVQALYAAVDILGGGAGTEATQLPLQLGLLGYVALIVAFGIGVWRRAGWAWGAGIAAAAAGLALAGLRIATGESIEGHALGLLIDAGLLYFLFRPSTRALFAR